VIYEVEVCDKEGSDKVMILIGVFHVEEELEESGRCLGCVALHLLVHPAHFRCSVGVGMSLRLKRIGGHLIAPGMCVVYFKLSFSSLGGTTLATEIVLGRRKSKLVLFCAIFFNK